MLVKQAAMVKDVRFLLKNCIEVVRFLKEELRDDEYGVRADSLK